MPETTNPFIEAIEYMEEHGWYQGAWAEKPDGPVCLDGALHKGKFHWWTNVPIWVSSAVNGCKAMNVRDVNHAARAVLAEILLEQYQDAFEDRDLPSDLATIAFFNDRVCPSQEEAYLMLEKAAVKWEEKVNGV